MSKDPSDFLSFRSLVRLTNEVKFHLFYSGVCSTENHFCTVNKPNPIFSPGTYSRRTSPKFWKDVEEERTNLPSVDNREVQNLYPETRKSKCSVSQRNSFFQVSTVNLYNFVRRKGSLSGNVLVRWTGSPEWNPHNEERGPGPLVDGNDKVGRRTFYSPEATAWTALCCSTCAESDRTRSSVSVIGDSQR